MLYIKYNSIGAITLVIFTGSRVSGRVQYSVYRMTNPTNLIVTHDL